MATDFAHGKQSCVRCDDAKKRSGAFSLERTYADWKRLTVDNQMELTASEQMKINVSTGSSTRQPVSQISDEKANNGFMHVLIPGEFH